MSTSSYPGWQEKNKSPQDESGDLKNVQGLSRYTERIIITDEIKSNPSYSPASCGFLARIHTWNLHTCPTLSWFKCHSLSIFISCILAWYCHAWDQWKFHGKSTTRKHLPIASKHQNFHVGPTFWGPNTQRCWRGRALSSHPGRDFNARIFQHFSNTQRFATWVKWDQIWLVG